ncbi:MAG: hypothetical protein EBR30_12465 [Cytophagia bacterium]|nr:hypothetical protein [Cytophagia bacterium]
MWKILTAKLITYLVLFTASFTGCNKNPISYASAKDTIYTKTDSESILSKLNSLGQDSLLNIIKLSIDLVKDDSIEKIEIQDKSYLASNGQCEETVLASVNLISSENETEYVVHFFIKLKNQQLKVSTPLIFEIVDFVDANYSIIIEDDTALTSHCSILRVSEKYEDEQVSYDRYSYFTVNSAGDFIKIFTYTPFNQIATTKSNENLTEEEKSFSRIEILEGRSDSEKSFKAIKLLVTETRGDQQSTDTVYYRYDEQKSMYVVHRN